LQKDNDIDSKQSGDLTTSEESEPQVPFNLNTLRKHLAKVALARRVLPEDVVSRQKLLEESVYDVAEERLKHQSSVFEALGLDCQGLMQAVLQKWMWDWHQKLQPRLEAEIKSVIEHEKGLREFAHLSSLS
jgi:DNA-directed RNA polymerase, mitochondrial